MFIKREDYEALQRKAEIQQFYIHTWYYDIIKTTYSEAVLKKDVNFAKGINETEAAYSEIVSGGSRQYQVYDPNEFINEYAVLAGQLEERMKQELKKAIQENPVAEYGENTWKLFYSYALRDYIPRIVRLVHKAEEDKYNMDFYENAKQMKRLIKIYGGFR